MDEARERIVDIFTEMFKAVKTAGYNLDDIVDEAMQRAHRLEGQAFQPISDPRFQLVTTFDITVPAGYNHATRLDTFKQRRGKEFSYCNPAITDQNFARATTQLAPSQQLRVKVFQITGSVTSDDCLNFLKTQNAILTGAQGATLAYEQAGEQLSKGRWHISFDEKDALPLVDGSRGVPGMGGAILGSVRWFVLGSFEFDWRSNCCLLCFCD